MPHILFVVLDAGPADECITYRVRLFSLEPTLHARPAHHTQLAGRLHVRHRPTRRAHVGRANKFYEAASRCFRGSEDICACSEPRAEGRNGIFRCHSRCARIVVHVFVRSVRLARGSKAHQGHRASSHVYVRCTKQCLVMPHMDSFDWTGVSNQLLKREFSSRSRPSRPENWDASGKWSGAPRGVR